VKIDSALQNITHLFLDTAPVIYYVEKNPQYFATVEFVFDQIDSGSITAVTSPVTLAECLVVPYRLGIAKLQQDFLDLIVYGNNTVFVSIDREIGRQAAELRARYNITLPDALQIASALAAGSQAFLTNDGNLERVTELSIIVLDEMSPP
jgi:predicted nucleic acid-binding protein